MTRDPDLRSDDGTIRAWHWGPVVDPVVPDWAAGLASWVVEADPEVLSPLFTRWLVGLCHLREIEGVTPPSLHFPGAEHEVSSWTVDPDYPQHIVDLYDERVSGTVGPASAHLLVPPDIVYQWSGLSDDQAVAVAEGMVRAVLAGASIDRPVDASAASVFDRRWRGRLDATVDHFRTGHAIVPEGRA